MIIMSVDLGKARTGIAVCDPTMLLASPVEVITESYTPKLVEKIVSVAQRLHAERIVVGLPLNMDGSQGESARNALDIAEQIRDASGIETVMYDERCSTVIAHNVLNVTDTRGKKRKAVVDAVAAVVILQDYLDSMKHQL